MRNLVLAAALAIGLVACSAPADQPSAANSPEPTSATSQSPTAAPASFTVTSSDFTDGAELPDFTTANAFSGQCVGENLSPALAWTDVPEGTQSFAIVMIDRSASNFIHWVQFDIPGDLAGIGTGESATVGGTYGATTLAQEGYFGPCPPGPDHRYEFTIYALDAMLGLEEGARFADVKAGIDAHLLAQASIVGMRTGPA
jgi:Raf kinase inhibitor-like YbhB/YbcL family protein